jgi:hypothetical protein
MTEGFTINRWGRETKAFLSAFLLLLVAACGGGGSGSSGPSTPTGSLTITPGTVLLDFGAAPVTFVVSGGVKPYALTSSFPSLIPVGGVGDDGRFTITAAFEPNAPTIVTLTVRDAQQNTVTAQVTVGRTALALSISPTTARTTFGVPVTYQITGGRAPYSVVSSFPSIIANPTVDANGRFTVLPLINPPANADVTLTVRDALGATVTAQLQIQPLPLSVSPSEIQVGANIPVTFTITGGSAPYTIISSQPNIVPNPTSVDAQGRFTLRAVITPTTVTPVLITIRDAQGNVVTATLTVLPTTPIPLVVLPTTSIVFANAPATLTIFGGSPPYQAISSNPTVLPVTRNVVGDQILLAPINVDADTQVTITVVDSSNATATATVTVKPAPLLNTLTITPTPAAPGTGCGSAVCAGQTASATVTVRNAAGAGLQGRTVRFENVQGNYQFITSGPGLPETLANSITVTTDQNGQAIVRLRADVNAPTQVALIRATELTSGNVLNGSFVIAQFTAGAGTLTAIPTTWTLTGPDSSNCAANVPVTYYIFGGTPPYRIQSTLPGFVNIVPPIVQTNGGGFTAVVTGTVCTNEAGAPITITDATGRTIAVTLVNTRGTGNPPTNFNAIQFVPGDITSPALGCGESTVQQVVGGEIRLADGTLTQPTFIVSSLTPNVTATLSGRALTITRSAEGNATSPALIVVSNGVGQATLRIAVAPSCGTPVATIDFTPSSPVAIACASGSSSGDITISGAPGPYTATVPFPGLTANIVGNILTVTRTASVTEGSQSLPVNVTNNVGASGTLFIAPPGTCS